MPTRGRSVGSWTGYLEALGCKERAQKLQRGVLVVLWSQGEVNV